MLAVLLALAIAPDDPPAFVEITPEVERSSERARTFLLKSQNRDGSWGLDPGTQGDVTCTAMACMALMAGGNTQKSGLDPAAVASIRKGLDYVLPRARKNPQNIVSEATTLIQGKLGKDVHTFFAATFLSQAFGMEELKVTPEERTAIGEIVTAMCKQIARTQDKDGSWQKDHFGGLKGTCMAWLALRSAHSAGIAVEDASVRKVVEFIEKQYNKKSHMFSTSGGHDYQSLYASSSCLRVLHGMGQQSTTVDLPEAYKALYGFVSKGGLSSQFLSVEGEDYLASAMITQAMMKDGGPLWVEWFGFIRQKMIRQQNKDGSWTGTACISGRIFATSCSLLTLQAPYRQLPMQDL